MSTIVTVLERTPDTPCELGRSVKPVGYVQTTKSVVAKRFFARRRSGRRSDEVPCLLGGTAKAAAEIVWWGTDIRAVHDEITINYYPDDASYVVPADVKEDKIMGTVSAVIAGFGFVIGIPPTVGAILILRARGRAAAAHRQERRSSEG